MICGFVPKAGVVSTVGGCLWVCFRVLEVVLDLVFVGLFLIWSGEREPMENEERRKRNQEIEQGTRVSKTRVPSNLGLSHLICYNEFHSCKLEMLVP